MHELCLREAKDSSAIENIVNNTLDLVRRSSLLTANHVIPWGSVSWARSCVALRSRASSSCLVRAADS